MRHRRLVAVAVLAALVAVAPGLPAAVAQTPSGAAGEPSLLRLLGRSPWVGDGLDFNLSVQAVAPPPGAQVQVTVHDRVRNRTQFAASLAGEGLRRRLSGPSPAPLAAVDPDGDGTFSLLVPLVTAEGIQPVAITTPGVYPVVVDLLDGDGEVTTTLRTHLVRLAGFDGASTDVPLGVAVVVPLGGPPSYLSVELAGDGEIDDREVDADVVAAVTNLTAALVARPGVPVTLHAVPESLAVVGGADPETVAALAAALGTSEVLARPWVPIDEAAWEAADDTTLTRLLTRGREQLAASLGVTPSTTRLLGAGEPVEEAATMVGHGAGALVVAESDLEVLDPADFPYTVARPFRLALDREAPPDDGTDDGEDAEPSPTVPAVAADAALTTLAATAEDDPILAAHQMLADLAVIAGDEPESARAVTVVLPGVAAASPEFLAELLAGLAPPVAPPAPPPPPVDPDADPALPPPVTEVPVAIPAAAPLVRAMTVETVMAAVEPAGAGGGADRDEPLVRRVTNDGAVGDVGALARRLTAVRADLASYRSIFGGDDGTASLLDTILATVTGEALETAERQVALESVSSTITARIAGLGPPERQRVSLTDRDGQIQLVLTNDTGQPADIVLHLRGDRLIFPDATDGELPVHLPGGATRIDLRVRARSSGDAPVDIRVTSPDGRIDLGSSRLTVRTTAISGVGIALMIAAAAFLAVWWTRTILRERRSAKRRHPTHMRAG